MDASEIDVRAAEDDPTLLVRVGDEVWEIDRRVEQPVSDCLASVAYTSVGLYRDGDRRSVKEAFDAKPQCQDVSIGVAKMIGRLAWEDGYAAAY